MPLDLKIQHMPFNLEECIKGMVKSGTDINTKQLVTSYNIML